MIILPRGSLSMSEEDMQRIEEEWRDRMIMKEFEEPIIDFYLPELPTTDEEIANAILDDGEEPEETWGIGTLEEWKDYIEKVRGKKVDDLVSAVDDGLIDDYSKSFTEYNLFEDLFKLPLHYMLHPSVLYEGKTVAYKTQYANNINMIIEYFTKACETNLVFLHKIEYEEQSETTHEFVNRKWVKLEKPIITPARFAISYGLLRK